MDLLIAGASGFIGQKLVKALGPTHKITVLGRDTHALKQLFSKPVHTLSWEALPDLDAKGFDAVINLCGHNIGASSWNATVKKQLIASRVETTRTLINWLTKNQARPHFICANAVGIYSMQHNEDNQAFDEDSPINFEQPCDFLSEIGVRWQQALQPAIDYGMPVTSTRFGVVLGKGEGILKKLHLSFSLGLGAKLGDGKQTMSWIHIEDLIAALMFLLDNPKLQGAFNLSSPFPISQAEFARALASTYHRPLWLTMPAFVVRALFGEMGDCLLLKGQRVLPKRLLEAGFKFKFPHIEGALKQEFLR